MTPQPTEAEMKAACNVLYEHVAEVFEPAWSDRVRAALSAAYAVAEADPRLEAQAREKLASWMIQNSFSTGHGDTIEDLLIELDGQIKDRAALAAAYAVRERESAAPTVEVER